MTREAIPLRVFLGPRGLNRKVFTMGWLGKLRGNGGAAVAEAIPGSIEPKTQSGPPLIILVNDASGRASFKLNVFEDIDSATEWVRYWFPHEAEDGFSAFWALTEQPEGGLDNATETAPEALVLIRDAVRQGVVYLFSFVDIDSAQKFLREEVGRGTKLGAVMMYWAVQVKRHTNRRGELVLIPSTPPGIDAPEIDDEVLEVAGDGWAIPQEMPTTVVRKEPAGDPRALLKEAPNAYIGISENDIDGGNETFALTSWAERNRDDTPVSQGTEDDHSRPEVPSEASAQVAPPATETTDENIEYTEEVAGAEVSNAPESDEPVANGIPQDSRLQAAIDEAVALVNEKQAAFRAVREAADSAGEAQVAEDQAVETPPPAVEAIEEDEVAVEAAGDPIVEPNEIEENTPISDAVSSISEPATTAEEDATEVVAEPSTETQDLADAEEHSVGSNGNGNGHGQAHLEATQIIVQVDGSAANGHTPDVTGLNEEGTAPIVVSANGNGHSKGHANARTPAEAVIEARGFAETEGTLDKASEARIAAHLESKALKMRRWEVRDEPFEGFKSPPGRF